MSKSKSNKKVKSVVVAEQSAGAVVEQPVTVTVADTVAVVEQPVIVADTVAVVEQPVADADATVADVAEQSAGADSKVKKSRKKVKQVEEVKQAEEVEELKLKVEVEEVKQADEDKVGGGNVKTPKTPKAKTLKAKVPKAKVLKAKVPKAKVSKTPKEDESEKVKATIDVDDDEIVADVDETSDRRVRSFKVKLPDNADYEGRFTGLTPYQAANKALSKYFREGKKDLNTEISFCICESTRKSKKHVYTYTGSRVQLATPVKYTIQDGREIVKNFKNNLKKVKKADAKILTESSAAPATA